MKRNASLTLIELTVMVLVFALAAVLCLRAFVWADVKSRENFARDRAVLLAQSAAETLKSQQGSYAAAAERLGGTWDGESWTAFYDEDWQPASGEASYRLCVLPRGSELDGLGTASVEVWARETLLISFAVSWQEVVDDG